VGKSTLAGRLGRELAIPHHELDALFWGPGWHKCPEREFRDRVEKIVGGESWLIDGYYPAVVDLISSRVETFVWLDVGWGRTLTRLARRTVRRAIGREPLWNENRENLRSLFGPESVLLYALRVRGRVVRENRELSDALGRRGVSCYRFSDEDDAESRLLSCDRAGGDVRQRT
jgi:hypothetical protein